MEGNEGEGRSEMEFTEIKAPIDSFDSSAIFHVVTNVVGFVLYMHQQIPSILQDISLEFDTLHAEYQELEMVLTQTEAKASSRRKHAGKMRELKQGIRRLEKLMKTVSSVQTALQLVISEIPDIQGVILVLGASPIRPQHVYEMCFSHGSIVTGGACGFTKSKVAEAMSRKAIRALISIGAGSNTYAGPSKLFLLVKAPSSFSSPLHFLPKRDFRYNKKIVPFRLQFKCRTQYDEKDASHNDSWTASSIALTDSASNDLIWFQCRHVIKGLTSNASAPEE
ncbi:uncharacterized protein LOC131156709 [Malania oleifera]|uniref:uncharacterized protein LOC131156709 n=1 Tax=Malania oleifera TaxID=397392 RepID=UPI0025AD9EEE|nr:uncharacterized protein LOC131156709 [Malania oleifera]